MPCRCDGYPSTESRQREEIDALTQKLCYLCAEILSNPGDVQLTLKIKEWWDNHYESDTKRVYKEMKSRFEGNNNIDAGALAQSFISKALAVHDVSKFHRDWFHNIADFTKKEVLNKQNKKQAALNKLTPEEKKMLFNKRW